jgi:membrane dipeptidase
MEILQNEWSRRKFMTTLTGASAATLMSPFLAWATTEIDPKVAAIVAKTIGIDTHNHVDVPLNTDELPDPHIDLLGDLKKSGLSAICMTFAVDRPALTEAGQAFNRFISGIDAMDIYLKNNQITRSLNLKDLKNAHKHKQATVIQSLEGGHFLEGKLERLEIVYKRGLRLLGLLHDAQPSVPIGDIYTDQPKYGGLTDFGIELVKECNRLGILIDLTHCNNEAINTALKISSKPVIVSHTGLDSQLGTNENMAKMMRPRLISKEQAKIVAEAGGVIGVWTHLAESPTAYIQNIRAMVEVVGIDHVCLGTDTKLTPSYQYFGNKSAVKKTERAGERTNGAWQNQTEGFYYTVVAEMLKADFTETEIEKIGGGNFCRVFDVATKNK